MSFEFRAVTTQDIPPDELSLFMLETFGLVRSVLDLPSADIAACFCPDYCSQIVIYNPTPVDVEDLDNWAENIVANPKWLFCIYVNIDASARALTIARTLTTFLAKAGDGAAYDLQQGLTLYPSALNATRKAQQRYVDLVEMEFMLPIRSLSSETASTVLAVLATHCPSGRPTRFGMVEPLRGRLTVDDDRPFLRAWESMVANESADTLVWKAKSPCYGGYAFHSKDTTSGRYGRFPRHKIGLSFTSLVAAEPCWSSTLTAIFQTLSNELSAFYAAAYVIENAVVKGDSIWFTSDTRGLRFDGGANWLGIPNTPTWLAWYGGSYAKVLQTHLAKCTRVHRMPGGQFFLQTSERPETADYAGRQYPTIPGELVRPQWDKAAAKILPPD